MAQKRKRSFDASDAANGDEAVFRSEPVEDRQSTFIGYYSPTLTGKELQRLDGIAGASHKILAWRKPSKQRSLTGTIFEVGHDDDGERYGGRHVEKALEQAQASGACVVARWYGGVMLGPVRFTHIETCARDAIRQWQTREAEAQAKKRKQDEDAVAQKRLAQTLLERDKSIDVLRALAAEKERQVKDALVEGMQALEGKSDQVDDKAQATNPPTSSSQDKRPPLDYASMPLERLKALDKARDATLAFLLKRIDKAEADMAAISEPVKSS